jgi:peptidoglycan/xylan/chitin deacetylase (PgdA/CDA1 family)
MLKIDLDVTIRRYEIIIALIILLLTGSIIITSNKSGPSPARHGRYPYRIALTFDDGPHPYFTEKLLALLQRENVKATFFVVGRMAMEYPYLVQEISLAGHELAGHSFSHRNLSRLSDPALVRELNITRGIIQDLTGKKVPYFRPPGGQFNGHVVTLARTMGLSMVLWTVFPKDHELTDPDVVVERVLQQVSDGGIVLLHSGMPATFEALPRIIGELRKRGYRFVTVEELNLQERSASMQKRPFENGNIKDYEN